MNKDQIKGRAEQVKGKVVEIAGNVVGSDKLKTQGKVEQLAGKVRSGLGDAKEAVKDKLNKVTNRP
jgi:uncharacterized protein YjbJ (UPF0337 family)